MEAKLIQEEKSIDCYVPDKENHLANLRRKKIESVLKK